MLRSQSFGIAKREEFAQRTCSSVSSAIPASQKVLQKPKQMAPALCNEFWKQSLPPFVPSCVLLPR